MRKIILALTIVASHIVPQMASAENQLNMEFTESASSLNSQLDAKLSDQEKSLAKQWMLKESDWGKYKQIMKGPRGTWSPGLDPITALGVSESDPVERERLALIWVKMESQRVVMELEFEKARMKAAKEFHEGTPRVDNSEIIAEWNRKQNEIHKQVYLFVEPDCVSSCSKLFDDVMGSIGRRSRLEVVFMGDMVTDSNITDWAMKMGIDPSDVHSRKVALKSEIGQASALDVSYTSLPAVRVKDLRTGEVKESFMRATRSISKP